MDLLPGPALYEVARVLTFGAHKYADHNWTKGMKWSRVIGALERHLEKFKRRQNLDDESGLLHISQVACNALFLTTYQLMNLGEDDRWNPPKEAVEYMKQLQQWIDQTQEQIQQGIEVDLSLDGKFKLDDSMDMQLNDELKNELYNLAKQKGCTVNSLVQKMLKDELNKEEKNNSTNRNKDQNYSDLNTPW